MVPVVPMSPPNTPLYIRHCTNQLVGLGCMDVAKGVATGGGDGGDLVPSTFKKKTLT